jgi:hypothetical protein
MGGMFGGGAKGSNDAVVREQQLQAEEARLKEAARQGRLTEGMKAIKGAFEGSPVLGTRKVQKTRQETRPRAAPPQNTWSPGADSQAYNASARGQQANVNAYGDAAYDPRFMQANADLSGNAGGFYQQTGGELGGNGMQWVSNASYMPATPDEVVDVAYEDDETYDTGQKTGGFGDKFYNDYGQSVVDYYQPQVDKQYKDAGKELTYRLSRAGNLRSQAAAGEVADLSGQYDINKANVLNKADIAKGDLRDTVAAQRAKLETALYATEDPTTATNNAIASVRDISLQQPEMSPLGAIFNVATIGGANFLRGAQNAKYAAAFPDGGLPRSKAKVIG